MANRVRSFIKSVYPRCSDEMKVLISGEGNLWAALESDTRHIFRGTVAVKDLNCILVKILAMENTVVLEKGM